MCRLQNLAMRDYQESVTTGHTHTDRWTDETPDKVIPMCRYASQATQKCLGSAENLTVGRVTGNRHIFYFGLNACVVGNTSVCCCEHLV